MTGDRPPPGRGTVPVDSDPLAAFLKAAQREGALEGENLDAFVTGLRQRADLVIAERLGRAETRLRVLESENEWQKDTVTGLEGARATLEGARATLEAEKAWLRETIATLERERDWLRETHRALEGEKAGLRETIGTLGETVGALEGERAWLRETLGGIEAERVWLRETIGALEEEKARLRKTISALEAEAILRTRVIEDTGEERRKASAAHESLLTHHRELMAQLAGQLGEIASLSPLRAREVRRRLRVLADLLRADTL